MPKAHKPLTFPERQIIEDQLARKKSHRKIASLLSRDHTVITREIRRSGRLNPYSAVKAQLRADQKLLGKRKKKLETDLPLRIRILGFLRKLDSPEQIAGRLKKESEGQLVISHETIYQYIYSDEGKQAGLYKYLRTNRLRRRLRGNRKTQGSKIPERVSIHERPAEVASKSRYGDWESDTVESGRNGKGGLSVQYERKSQTCRIHKLTTKQAAETTEAITKTIDSLPLYLFKTITFDNGTEGTEHTEIRDQFDIGTYFCDPYCSWQKGGVENLNKLIRQFFPKKTDFSKVSEEEIQTVQENLNNRPRKGLDYRTPNEVLAEVING